MRSVLFDHFGEPADVLRVVDAEPRAPGAGEVRVRMIASPINPSDLMTIRGIYGVQPPLPATPGYEGVGVVESAGGGFLAKMLVGKRIAVLNRDGGNWSERVVIPARMAVPLPAELPWEQAAMFFVNPATAVLMTRYVLAVPTGAWLLQTAAASALGRMVVRLGHRHGFRTLNVVRRRELIEDLERLGGDAVVAFDPARESPDALHDAVGRITGGLGAPFALDPVGGGTGSAVVGCLGDGGRMLVYGTLSNDPLALSPRILMGRGIRIEGFWLSRYVETMGIVSKLRLVRMLSRLIRSGVLASEVGTAWSLESIADAVREAERPGRTGKVLLQIGRG